MFLEVTETAVRVISACRPERGAVRETHTPTLSNTDQQKEKDWVKALIGGLVSAGLGDVRTLSQRREKA